MFETASFHIIKPCNFKCSYCYATFDDFRTPSQMPLHDAMNIIRKLKDGGLQKITFAGGEPMLYRHIDRVIEYSKSLGLTTSIITNGSFITKGWLKYMKGSLDWIGVSIDSTSAVVNTTIGRERAGGKQVDYYDLIGKINHYKYKLKINTVVNVHNWQEDFNNLINYANPERWKVFQALKVEGQNDEHFDEIKVADVQFSSFIKRHHHLSCMVAESNYAMTGSYLLIDPLGRLFENSEGKHTYSDPLHHNTLEHCLLQININRERFIERGGIYNW